MIVDFLSLHVKLRPEKIAVSDLTSGRQWTYRQWDYLVSQTIGWLFQNKIFESDRVACLASNCAEIVALSLACGRAGILFVPLNWRLSKEEINTLLVDCKPTIVIADSKAESLEIPYIDIDTLFSQVAESEPTFCDNTFYESPSLILYTSGTTGVPKGVLHSEASIMETTLNMALLAYVDDRSVFLCEAPMFHIIGLISSIRPVLYQGGTILISDRFIPSRTLSRLSDDNLKISHYFCVPQMAQALRQETEFEPHRLSNLKALLTGGAPHPEVQIKEWLNDGIPIVDGYGMSEAGTIFHMPFDIETIDRKAGFVGVPGHRIQTRITDPQGNVIKDGRPGEVQVKGKNLFLGIWNNPDIYSASFTQDGWFKTGDVAIQDRDGFHRIVDRIKDMFISGGENVYPIEVEGVAISDVQVQECALIGVPDTKWGEVGCLFVVLAHGVDELDTEALLTTLERTLARYKLPKFIRVIGQLPRTGAGKVRKNLLKEMFN